MSDVECTSKIEVERHQRLRAVDVRDWVAGLPEGAVLSAIQSDFGTQRDPEMRLMGLRAAWSEDR